jgi:HPt (histidine-containing phosphotransfer) domain-containing protein
MSNGVSIDPEAIENLRALSPDDGDVFLKDIIGIFIEDTPARIAELREALADADAIRFTRAAHSIKGSSSNLGAIALRDIAADLEHRSRQSGLGELGPLIQDLETTYLAAKETLEKIVASSPS